MKSNFRSLASGGALSLAFIGGRAFNDFGHVAGWFIFALGIIIQVTLNVMEDQP